MSEQVRISSARDIVPLSTHFPANPRPAPLPRQRPAEHVQLPSSENGSITGSTNGENHEDAHQTNDQSSRPISADMNQPPNVGMRGEMQAGPALVGAMSMVFTTEPISPWDSEQAAATQSIPGLEATTEPTMEDQDGPSQARRNGFPPDFPPEIRPFITALFGDSLTSVPSANREIEGENRISSQNTNAASETFDRSSDDGSSQMPPFNADTREPEQTEGGSTVPTTSGGLIGALLSTLLGDGNQSGSPSNAPSTPSTASEMQTTSSDRTSRVHIDTPTSTTITATHSTTQTNGASANAVPLVTGNPVLPLAQQIQTHVAPLSQGLGRVPITSDAAGLPRPFVSPPFPTNFSFLRPATTQQQLVGQPIPSSLTSAPGQAPPSVLSSATQAPPAPPQRLLNPRPTHFDVPMQPFPASPQRPQKKWNLPEGRGASVRQRVEDKERQMGLRCSDPSCGYAPTDEVPSADGDKLSCVFMHKEGAAFEHACEHTFHSGCLVSSARVAGFEPEELLEGDVEVPCTVCRTHGYVEKETWLDGVRQLQIADP